MNIKGRKLNVRRIVVDMPGVPNPPPVANVLSPEREKAVRKAERLLTMPQRETIERCRRAVNNANLPFVIRRRPRGVKDHPAWLKGKGVDPTEWANTSFSEDEIGLEAQHAALES